MAATGDTKMSKIVIANAAMTMTLKEITDLLKVRHDKAMLKVAEMAKEPEFGWMSKTDIQYSSGKGRIETIETYQLNKRQSIAVSARLNTALLMRIIDRWQELENQSKPAMPTTYIAALEALVASEKATLTRWLFCLSERKTLINGIKTLH